MEHTPNGKPLRNCSDIDLYAECEELSWRRTSGGLDSEQTERFWSLEAELKNRNVLR